MKVLEAKAVWEGLKSLINLPGKPMEIKLVESDCLELINSLIRVDEDLSKLKVFLVAIMGLSQTIGVLRFKHCPRSQNGATHSLSCEGAGLACRSGFFV